MSNVAIRVDGLGKQYRIGGQKASYKTLRDTLAGSLRSLARRDQDRYQTIWALKDVSFELDHGSVLGIVGENGAGKTTFLKLLARITEPTAGRAEVRGRIGALLEVGTGFHPELTGRENIYLNGAILGMSRRDIDREFERIVAFSEMELFLDTPVKHYSSGMYTRLAFSVAAHLEPDVLLVDEVLAVGDASFQKKCIGKIGDVAREGRTVIFVSHNMGAVKELTRTCIWLSHGTLRDMGETTAIVDKYLGDALDEHREDELVESNPEAHSRGFKFTRAEIRNGADRPAKRLAFQEPYSLYLEFELSNLLTNLNIGMKVSTTSGVVLFSSHHSDVNNEAGLPSGCYSAQVPLKHDSLKPDVYAISIGANLGTIMMGISYIENAILFEVAADPYLDTRGPRPNNPGLIDLDLKWQIESKDVS